MNAALIISIVGCLFVIALVLIKPAVTINGHKISVYWIPALLSAIILMIFNIVDIDFVLSSFFENTPVNPLKILTLFISMVLLSVYLDEVGFFKYLASVALKRAGSNGIKIFTIIYFVVGMLTIVTSNDIIVLTFSPFICYFAKNAKINPLPYLIGEFVSANTWSMTLIIGNPTNIFLATGANIAFLQYLKDMILPTIIGGLIAYLLLILVFYKKLKNDKIECDCNIEKIEDKTGFIIGLIHLVVCTVILVFSSYLKIEMWYVSLFFAVSLFMSIFVYDCIKHKSNIKIVNTIKRAPYELIPFVISMFIIVLALKENGVTEKFAVLLSKLDASFANGIGAFLFSNVINNIPTSVLFESILSTESLEGVYAAIAGTNIGAYFTPIGALAGIMWSSILSSQNVKFNFLKFVAYGGIIAIPTLMGVLATINLLM